MGVEGEKKEKKHKGFNISEFFFSVISKSPVMTAFLTSVWGDPPLGSWGPLLLASVWGSAMERQGKGMLLSNQGYLLMPCCNVLA